MMKKKILFLGRLAPPMHGAARMNELYLNSKIINNQFIIKKIKLNYSKSLKGLGRFSVLKIFKIFIAFFRLLFNLIFYRPNLIYFEIAPTGKAFIRDSFFVWPCKLFRRKILFHFHARGMIKSRYAKSVFKNTKAIILSKTLYPYFSKVIPRKSAYLLGNGIIDELGDKKFKEVNKIKNKKKKFLFLSNMIESKGPLEVLKICDLLQKKDFNFECFFVGAWDNEETKRKFLSLLKKYNLEKKCKYLGKKYGQEKLDILSKTDYLLFPTKYEKECYPLVILEAFMFGIPVLTYNTGAIKDIMKTKELGFISAKNNYKDLYEYLKKNINKPINKQNIRKYFKEHFLLETAENKLLEILRESLK